MASAMSAISPTMQTATSASTAPRWFRFIINGEPNRMEEIIILLGAERR